jgi:EAL domain-containing protein (putative c-di-GMP-specific phosphodiesterase class I)
MGQLNNFEFDYLKIDRQFVMCIDKVSIKSSLISSIVEIGKSLNVTIVAEGVETPEQQFALQLLDIQLAQGWLYGKAMQYGELLSLMGGKDCAEQILCKTQNQTELLKPSCSTAPVN